MQYFKFSFSPNMVNLSLSFILGILYVLMYSIGVEFFDGMKLYREHSVKNREVKITLTFFGPVVGWESGKYNQVSLVHFFKYPGSKGLEGTLDKGILSFVRSYIKLIKREKSKLNLDGKYFLAFIELRYIEPYKVVGPVVGEASIDRTLDSVASSEMVITKFKIS